MDDAWERHAGWWQDGFTAGADPEYEEQILPILADALGAARRVVDVGCGEGQLARRAAARGASIVVGLDGSSAQLGAATKRGGGPVYVRARAEAMPVRSEACDVVIACLVFEHIDALDAACAEVARVLEPGGRFLFFLNHPLLQTPGSGWIDDRILGEQYWRIGPYLVESFDEEELAPGVRLPFVHRPLHRYVNALAEHGLLVRRMLEPGPPEGFLARAQEYRDAATVPRLLFLEMVKTEAPAA